MKENLMITVSIVTYKTDLAELEKCLASLSCGLVERIFVVDNANERRMEDFCRRYDVEYIGSENVGYGAGPNKAIRRAMELGAEYHLVVNTDVRFEPAVLEKLAEYMDGNPQVGQVQPKVVYPSGELQYTCRMLPTPWILALRRFAPKGLIGKCDDRYLLKFRDHDKPMDVPYHQGSFMFFRVASLKEIGLFDERFFMYPEDIDISRRMHKRFATMYWPGVTVVHDHRAASYKNWRMLKVHIVNMIRYFNKWGWLFDRERTAWNKLLQEKR